MAEILLGLLSIRLLGFSAGALGAELAGVLAFESHEPGDDGADGGLGFLRVAVQPFLFAFERVGGYGDAFLQGVLGVLATGDLGPIGALDAVAFRKAQAAPLLL